MSDVLKRRMRCAVYTRKSSEEGLDQEYNSIDAQRDAGHAYVASQRAEGWIPVADDYDDPAFSGGNMERPGLKRLMTDIEAGKIDVIVIYKIDRLTRSLADFSKMVEVFERQGVSFVSVTQQFNTTTSMGRLMLNVLLSFAQFEREVKRAHIYELLAASFGFNSYAALGVDTILTQQRPDDEPIASYSHFVRGRCIELGYQPESADLVSVSLGSFLADRHIGIVRISELISQLRGDWVSQKGYPIDDAEQFGEDPSFFERPLHDVGADPSAVAEIAERLGRVADAKHWLTVAAESGDTDAMLRLIEEHDQGDLTRCWTWVYLSRLVGTDLSKDEHYAINEDGSEYEDDVGGPAYAAGRDGVDIDPLSADQEAAARDAARALFEQIQRAAAPMHRR